MSFTDSGKSQLEDSLGWQLEKPYAVVTFHPVTLESNSAESQCQELLSAFDANHNMDYIITKANADSDGRVINKMFEEYAEKHDNVAVFDSLGMIKYLSALKYAQMVIGNSSSGLIEVPAFKIPTINIGDRQKGRLRAASVIDCLPTKKDICAAIEKANSNKFRKSCSTVVNPYGDGKVTNKIIEAIRGMMNGKIEIKKSFFDLGALNE